MKKLLLCIALSLSSVGYAATPSEQSVRELLAITDAKSIIAPPMKDVEDMIKESSGVAELEQTMRAENQDELAAMKKSVDAILQDELAWKKLEPMMLKIYRDTYTQSDIDGMLKFYKSKAGQSVTKSTPAMMKKIGDDMGQYLEEFEPKISSVMMDAMLKSIVEQAKSE